MAEKKGWKSIPIGGMVLNTPTSLEYKTGTWRSFRPVWHPEKCIHCLQCWYVCPDFAIHAKDGKITSFDYEYCKGCGLCACREGSDARSLSVARWDVTGCVEQLDGRQLVRPRTSVFCFGRVRSRHFRFLLFF